jgi:DNA-binding HxlR family transcriptional regulator
LRESFWGVRRFADFQKYLGIPRAVLSNRLGKLADHGLLKRGTYKEEGQRQREEYVFTPAAMDLLPALIALMQWGDAHLGRGHSRIVDQKIGAPLSVQVVTHDGVRVSPNRIRAVPI